MTVKTFKQDENPDYTTHTNASDYKDRLERATGAMSEVANNFSPHESDTPNMQVVIEGGKIFSGLAHTVKGRQTTAAFTAPTTNPRIDRIAIDMTTGDLVIREGVEAVSPVPLDYLPHHYPVCQFRLENTTTTISNSAQSATNAEIKDERGLVVNTTPLVEVLDSFSGKTLLSNNAAMNTLFSYNIPEGETKDGDILRLKVTGTYYNENISTISLNIRVALGIYELVDSNTLVTVGGGGLEVAPFNLETVINIGASGSNAVTRAQLGDFSTLSEGQFQSLLADRIAYRSYNVSWAGAKTLLFGVQMASTADPLTQFQLFSASVEILRS